MGQGALRHGPILIVPNSEELGEAIAEETHDDYLLALIYTSIAGGSSDSFSTILRLST